MSAKILIVDDDPAIVRLAKRYLADNGFAVASADNGSDGLALAREALPDVILLDAEMPGLDGHALCRMLKQGALTRRIPVVIMSGSRVAEQDVLAGFDGGADDYVAKPFSLPVLAARLRAVMRRYKTQTKGRFKLKKAGIELDVAARTVKVEGKGAALTRKEFDLLAALLEGSGRVHSIPYLLETVWGYDPADYNDPRTVEVHISQLRKKLGPKAAKRLVAVLGHGYRFDA